MSKLGISSGTPDTSQLIWELTSFLAKKEWVVGPATPPPAVCMAGQSIIVSAFVMVFIDGNARGGGDVDGLLRDWLSRLPDLLKSFEGGELSSNLTSFLVLCFCDLPEPLATEVLHRKDLRVFSGRHGFCRSIDFQECTIREHAGVPYFSGYGTPEIAEFLEGWSQFRTEQ